VLRNKLNLGKRLEREQIGTRTKSKPDFFVRRSVSPKIFDKYAYLLTDYWYRQNKNGLINSRNSYETFVNKYDKDLLTLLKNYKTYTRIINKDYLTNYTSPSKITPHLGKTRYSRNNQHSTTFYKTNPNHY
jgi:hypothetical protein